MLAVMDDDMDSNPLEKQNIEPETKQISVLLLMGTN